MAAMILGNLLAAILDSRGHQVQSDHMEAEVSDLDING